MTQASITVGDNKISATFDCARRALDPCKYALTQFTKRFSVGS